jgi:cytochrome oxidase Cu insertion factor (SCO1/SenC/PrrC family)
VKRGRVKLVLLGALFATPVIAGWIVYAGGWVSGKTSNYGTLLGPQPLAAQPLAAVRGKWVLVQLDRAACDAHCEQKLYTMRQVRRAQGREMNRVERLWIVTDSGTPSPRLLAAADGMQIARGDAQLAAAFPAQRSASDHIYLVDPLGNLMLRFPRDPDPAQMIKDLQRLLKYSGFG